MAYSDHFRSTDDLIAHLDTVIPGLTSPVIRAQYTGFLCVAVVTVFELCIKELFVEFAEKKHRSFGTYCGNVFEKMNGRVALKDLKEVHIKKFGDQYVKKFTVKLEDMERRGLREERMSIKSSYGNVIVWRNSFAHEGILPPNASYEETSVGYKAGQKIVACLAQSMVR
jgi:hypothetical protein